MNRMSVLGSLIHYDFEKNIATFKFNFIDNELIKQIEMMLEHKSPIKLLFTKLNPFRSKTYKQQKKFWVDFYKIMKVQKIPITSDNVDELYTYIKKNVFPAREYSCIRDENNNIINDYYIPEMKDLSIEEMKKIIEDIHYLYSYLNINWGIEK